MDSRLPRNTLHNSSSPLCTPQLCRRGYGRAKQVKTCLQHERTCWPIQWSHHLCKSRNTLCRSTQTLTTIALEQARPAALQVLRLWRGQWPALWLIYCSHPYLACIRPYSQPRARLLCFRSLMTAYPARRKGDKQVHVSKSKCSYCHLGATGSHVTCLVQMLECRA